VVNADVVRGQVLLEESREAVVVLDAAGVVVAASRRARQSLGIREGEPLARDLLDSQGALVVPYAADGGEERLVYLSATGDLAAYEELRSGFTAAVSHELRTPLARLLSLLELAALPGEDVAALVEAARAEVEQIRELIDEVLFLAELESGARVVSLGATRVLPVLEDVAAGLEEPAARAGVVLHVVGDPDAAVEVRPRMLRVVAQNLAENAVRYAGPGATARLSVGVDEEDVILRIADDGGGVQESELPRLFERFYRADRSRASRGTGLGLAIVKHVVTSAGGTVEAHGGRGRGLEITCRLPLASGDVREGAESAPSR
jgi:two-component system phosphate regulon sensor histidine kinase PhoR